MKGAIFSVIAVLGLMATAGFSLYFANPGNSVGIGFYWDCTPTGKDATFTCYSGFPGWFGYLLASWAVLGVAGMYLLAVNLKRRFAEALAQ